MLISHPHRFIYLKTMKTGGTSVELYFERFCVDPKIPFEEHHARNEEVSEWGIVGCRQKPIAGQTFYHHLPAAGVRELIGAEIWESYFKFCVVRNPFDKAVSAFWFWLSAAERENLRQADFAVVRNAFTKWLKNAQLPDDRSVFMIEGTPAVNRFLRHESLERDLAATCAELHLPWNSSWLKRYKSEFRVRPEHYSEYYADEAAKRVREFYIWETTYFSYNEH